MQQMRMIAKIINFFMEFPYEMRFTGFLYHKIGFDTDKNHPVQPGDRSVSAA
jgi:hypothetical protein